MLFSLSWFSSQFSATAAPVVKAPDFSAPNLNGHTKSLKDYRGKHLVLYFWATWCPACRQEVEKLKRAYFLHEPRGVEFLSVSLDSDRKKLANFIEEKHIPYTVLFDGQGWKNQIAIDYAIISTPSYLVIGPEGNILTTGNWTSDLLDFLGTLS
ncbi:MAG: TlpA family protein disulfide reductase [Candidatus Omnitrophica bacterium]|nr:TlpA family protein disulfide reductase [Candidatus Omnitrophota bacterium]